MSRMSPPPQANFVFQGSRFRRRKLLFWALRPSALVCLCWTPLLAAAEKIRWPPNYTQEISQAKTRNIGHCAGANQQNLA
jgi:hypothetical protein